MITLSSKTGFISKCVECMSQQVKASRLVIISAFSLWDLSGHNATVSFPNLGCGFILKKIKGGGEEMHKNNAGERKILIAATGINDDRSRWVGGWGHMKL